MPASLLHLLNNEEFYHGTRLFPFCWRRRRLSVRRSRRRQALPARGDLGALEALQPGEAMRFCNDHDPLPLLSQIEGHFGSQVKIAYVSRAPGEIVIDFLVTE